MKKTNSLEETIKLLKIQKNKKICLITGCFDVIHKGHIALFKNSKRNSDIVVVGMENDITIKKSKGADRPFNNLGKRLENLSKIKDIDYVFPIDFVVKFGDKDVSKYYFPILKRIKPDMLSTNIYKDKYWREKEKMLKKLGIIFLKNRTKIDISTTKILKGGNYI